MLAPSKKHDMETQRSNRACTACRDRRVKICEKFGSLCPGYATPPRFKDETAKTRKRVDALSESTKLVTSGDRHVSAAGRTKRLRQEAADPAVVTLNLDDFTPVRKSSNANAQLLLNIDNTGADMPGLQDNTPPDDFFDLDIETYYANGNNACGFIPGVPVIMAESEELAFDDLTSSAKPHLLAPQVDYLSGSRAREFALLIRHFVEVAAPWMDLTDPDAYFTRIVPLKAAHSVLLRSAIAAVAARHLAQSSQSRRMARTCSHLPQEPEFDSADDTWFYSAASYYDRAINCLRLFLAKWTKSHDWSASPNTKSTQHLEDNFDDMVSAMCMFSLYESQVPHGNNLSQHLDGFRSIIQNTVAPHALEHHLPGGEGYRAAFWNFARGDVFGAYASNTPTRLDPHDLRLWTTAGLTLTGPDAREQPSQFEARANDALLSCNIIWLAARVVNLILNQESSSLQGTRKSADASPASLGTSGHTPASAVYSVGDIYVDQWETLRKSLEEWYARLPRTFQPYSTIELEPGSHFNRHFFSTPMNASALHIYHFAQSLLLINPPVDRRTKRAAQRLRFLKSAEDLQHHGREICNIALGVPPVSVQRQMREPLHLAGLCFEADEDRQLVIKLLRTVQDVSGLSTVQRIQDLYQEWDWEETS